MIYTCTLNPSIDYVMHVDDFNLGELNRADRTLYYPGGKGINVSRVMARLTVQSVALGYLGNFTGQFITNFLDEEGVKHSFVDTGQYTRINVKLKGDKESEINGPGPKVSRSQLDELLTQIKQLKTDDILILAGNVPSSLPKDFYLKIADLCIANGISLVVDTSGQALTQLIGKSIFLLKPNNHELGELFNTTITTKEAAAHYAQKLVQQGAKHVIVSMGGEGAIYVNEHQQLFATAPQGEVRNSVGAGDSVVAGFISALTLNKQLEEAFRYGVAAGSATAFQDDLCQQSDVDELVNRITITPLFKEGKVNENY
ncbi:1-phosphofructokinase [Halobacillus shinanisalinarum]|uniref:Tagatose-6-phosphate kinase n=1 Tax=Halobacillus shinanisalinarum TaxID=2932258 RepID=A0ABY4H1Y5_9BACI|nr:1-phosphofructokinase [Halobacillus shinanisalinarum]UOQ94324.1 1-phosphofructokinase [Halobacillus shinanisalinarum]